MKTSGSIFAEITMHLCITQIHTPINIIQCTVLVANPAFIPKWWTLILADFDLSESMQMTLSFVILMDFLQERCSML